METNETYNPDDSQDVQKDSDGEVRSMAFYVSAIGGGRVEAYIDGDIKGKTDSPPYEGWKKIWTKVGKTVKLVATPFDGHTFLYWRLNGAEVNEPSTFNYKIDQIGIVIHGLFCKK